MPVFERKKETTWRESIHLGTRRVHIGGITPNPDQRCMAQIARNITDIDEGMLLQSNCAYLIHDRDSKFCEQFDMCLRSMPHITTLSAIIRASETTLFSLEATW